MKAAGLGFLLAAGSNRSAASASCLQLASPTRPSAPWRTPDSSTTPGHHGAMGRSRTLLLVASVLLAAVGVGLIALYVRGADQRALETMTARYGAPPTTPPPPPSPTPSAGHDDVAHLGLSIEVRDPNRVWALLGPGDLVSLWTIAKAGAATQVVPEVKVIAVGPRRSVRGVNDDTIPKTILVLDADVPQTKRILEGNAGGNLTVAVLGKDPTGTR
jgi:hypothetical protein